ncbi:MAG: insulinase family protein [Calditrichaeota bacterium]|nr:MAG: insulinase family protein [Calditrichota bacterium]
MLRSKLYVCLIFCLLFNTVIAQKEKPPQGGTPKDFKLPQKESFSLKNGLKATLVPYGKLPKVTIRIVVRAGNLNEDKNEVWLADLTGDMMKEGTEHRTGEQIALEAASMGGEVNVSVGADQTSISGDVLSEFAPDLVELLADIVRFPLFPESELERLKKDMIRDLNIQKSQPRSMAQEKFRQVLYGDHPYGRVFPTEAMIQSYDVQKVRNFYEKNFGALRTHIYVVGVFDENKVKQAIRKAFKDWQAGPEPLINIPEASTKRSIYIIDRPGARQSTVYVGLPVIDPSHPDYMALMVTNTLLGGSFASRITSNIREDKGYTYSPFSRVSARFRDAYWVEIADVTTEVTGPALREIFYEINRLQEEPPDQEELRGIQNYMAGTFVLINSSRSGIIGQLAFMDLHGLDESYLTNYVKNVYAVTPKQVQKIAQNYLRDEEMTIVIAGDRKKIEKQVAKFGPVRM